MVTPTLTARLKAALLKNDPALIEGIWRTPAEVPVAEPPQGHLAALGRSLADCVAFVGEAA